MNKSNNILYHYFNCFHFTVYLLFAVPFLKLPPPVSTRWNSIAMTIEAILRMKTLFEHIRDDYQPRDIYQSKDTNKTILELKAAVPSEESFKVYKFIHPVLMSIKQQSEMLSGDKQPTSPKVIPCLYKIDCVIAKVCFISFTLV